MGAEKLNRKIYSLIVIFLMFLVPLVNGLVGTIGNAKAIVTVDLEKTDILERTVLVRNVNNVSVTIKLESDGDLEDIIEILDNDFVLKENEEKNARFKVTIPKEGIYNGNIIVFFKPPEGKGAGVALQSTWTIKAINGDGGNNLADNKDDNTDNKTASDSIITGSTVVDSIKNNDFSLGFIVFLVLVAIVVVAGFIILMQKI